MTDDELKTKCVYDFCEDTKVLKKKLECEHLLPEYEERKLPIEKRMRRIALFAINSKNEALYYQSMEIACGILNSRHGDSLFYQ